MTTVPLKLHRDERQLEQSQSGELTGIGMALVTGLGLVTIICIYMIIFFSMGLLKH